MNDEQHSNLFFNNSQQTGGSIVGKVLHLDGARHRRKTKTVFRRRINFSSGLVESTRYDVITTRKNDNHRNRKKDAAEQPEKLAGAGHEDMAGAGHRPPS